MNQSKINEAIPQISNEIRKNLEERFIKEK